MTNDPDHKASLINAPDQLNHHVDMPLGSRKQAARTTKRDLIAKLMRDQDHRVIELLLQNSRIREGDVVTIAARRPTTVAILETIANHRKWKNHYDIKLTLCWNPHSPDQLIMKLLPTLMLQDLTEIAQSGKLPDRAQTLVNELILNHGHSPEEPL